MASKTVTRSIHAAFWPTLHDRKTKHETWKISSNKSTFHSMQKVVWLNCCGKSFLKSLFSACLYFSQLPAFEGEIARSWTHIPLRAFFLRPIQFHFSHVRKYFSILKPQALPHVRSNWFLRETHKRLCKFIFLTAVFDSSVGTFAFVRTARLLKTYMRCVKS